MRGYKTIDNTAKGELVVQKSRFIALAYEARTLDDANDFIKQVKGDYKNARHYVYAYSIYNHGSKYSDDGEPKGTAGVPLINLLEKRGLTNVVLIVVRYFGGVLLGKGGLIRAYSRAGSIALDNAGEKAITNSCVLLVKISYSQHDHILALMANHGAKIIKTVFDDFVNIYFSLPRQNIVILKDELNKLTSGQANLSLYKQDAISLNNPDSL